MAANDTRLDGEFGESDFCDGNFRCYDSMACFPRGERCNNKLYCDDGSDEWHCVSDRPFYESWAIHGIIFIVCLLVVFAIIFTLWYIIDRPRKRREKAEAKRVTQYEMEEEITPRSRPYGVQNVSYINAAYIGPIHDKQGGRPSYPPRYTEPGYDNPAYLKLTEAPPHRAVHI